MGQLLSIPDDVAAELDVLVDNLVTEDDTPVDNLLAEKQQRLLTEPLYSSWTGLPHDASHPGRRRRFLVAANVGLFPSVRQPPLVPDVFLSLDVTVARDWHEKRHRSYFFWEFGKPPEVVIEIVSNREGHEMGRKLNDYAQMGIIYYIVYDPLRQLGDQVLRVFEKQRVQYQPFSGSTLPGVGLGVGLWEGEYEGQHATWLRWCDEQGHVIPTGAERATREAERATREATARQQAEAELAQVRAELERLRQRQGSEPQAE